MKPNIFVTRPLPQVALDKLAEHFSVTLNEEDRPLEKSEIIEKVKNKDALLCLLTDTIDKTVMEAGSKLKVISNYAVGFNNIDVLEATKRNIPVCMTPGILTETTADLTWALILSVARRIVEADQYVRQGHWNGWGPMQFLGTDIFGKTLGIIGMGRIGQAVLKRANGFGMDVIYYSKTKKDISTAEFVSLDTLLKTSDFITIHTPLVPETHHLIGQHELKLMKSTAFLINTTRGPVVHEKDLVHALQNKVIAGAGLDVYEHEPLLEPGLSDLKNVVLLPHIGSATLETRSKMGIMAAQNAINILQGKKPIAIANPEVLLNKSVNNS